MLCAYAASQSSSDPLSGLVIGLRPDPVVRPGWSVVTLAAAGLNHHDVWSLQGVGLAADRLPMILGCDGAGVDEAGNEVIIHALVPSDGWVGDETLDPARTLLSERYDGTLAELVAVPSRNLVPKPPGLSFGQAACLSTAALTQLGSAARYRVWTTSRDEEKRAKALGIGADQVFAPGQRLPERVDAVMETVGAATWSHSINSLKPGGTVVISGATSGDAPAKAELTKIFFKQLRVVGSTMGNRAELERLTKFVVNKGITPVIDSTFALADARAGFAKMAAGDVFGKVVFTAREA